MATIDRLADWLAGKSAPPSGPASRRIPVFLSREDWLRIFSTPFNGDTLPPVIIRLRDAIESAIIDGIDTVLSETDPSQEE
jgi:hypothetical protein